MPNSFISSYCLDTPPCHSINASYAPTKKCKSNPNCLHGLKRKIGIWEENDRVLKSSLKLIWSKQSLNFALINQSLDKAFAPSTNQSSSSFLRSPETKFRSKNKYVGLKNLGATCYMNTLLQCLFMNTHFRHVLYLFRSSHQSDKSIHQSSKQQNGQLSSSSTNQSTTRAVSLFDPSHPDLIIHQLQHLFGLMEFGPQAVLDPELIAKSLGLNRYEQQDINEFNHLFLSLLESRLANHQSQINNSVNQTLDHPTRQLLDEQSNNQTIQLAPTQSIDSSFKHPSNGSIGQSISSGLVSTLIQDEFMGETISTVTCQSCKKASTKRSSFLDLSLQIKGKQSLTDCLNDLTSPDRLSDSNQYYCSICERKRDAVKQSKITKLPSILNLQLIRFGYNIETGTRTKLSDRIYIPYSLNMSSYMYDGSPNHSSTESSNSSDKSDEPSLCYQLTAILRHKGTSAHRGHYTAEIMDQNGCWWTFDDEKVTLSKVNQANNEAINLLLNQSSNQSNNQSSKAFSNSGDESLNDESANQFSNSSKKTKKRRKNPAPSYSKKRKRTATHSDTRSSTPAYQRAKTEEINLDSDGYEDQSLIQANYQDDVDTDGSVQSLEHPNNPSNKPSSDVEYVKQSSEQSTSLGEYSRNAYMLVYTVSSRLRPRVQAVSQPNNQQLSSQAQSVHLTSQSSSPSTDQSAIGGSVDSSASPRSTNSSINQSVIKAHGSSSLLSIKSPNLVTVPTPKRIHELSSVDLSDDDMIFDRLPVPSYAHPYSPLHQSPQSPTQSTARGNSRFHDVRSSSSKSQLTKQSSTTRQIEHVEISPDPSPLKQVTRPTVSSKLRAKPRSVAVASKTSAAEPRTVSNTHGFSDCTIDEDGSVIPESPPADSSANHSANQSSSDSIINPWANLEVKQSEVQLTIRSHPQPPNLLYNTSQSPINSFSDDQYIQETLNQSIALVNSQPNRPPNTHSISDHPPHKTEPHDIDGGSVVQLTVQPSVKQSKPFALKSETIEPSAKYSEQILKEQAVDHPVHEIKKAEIKKIEDASTNQSANQSVAISYRSDHYGPDSLGHSYQSAQQSLDPSMQESIKEWMKCEFGPQCQPPQFVIQSVSQKVLEMTSEKQLYTDYEHRLVAAIDQRKVEVDEFIDVELQFQEGLILEEDQSIDQSISGDCFIHTAFLQRWMNGLTPADLSDESVNQSTLPLLESDHIDELTFVDDEDVNMQAALKASAEESKQSTTQSDHMITIDSDLEADIADTYSNQITQPSNGSSNVPVSQSNNQSNGQSLAQLKRQSVYQFLPLWPGDIYESLSKLRCPHNRLDPTKNHLVKRISRVGWDQIVASVEKLEKDWLPSDHQSLNLSLGQSIVRDPLSDDNSFCSECVSKVHLLNQSIQDHRNQYAQLVEAMRPFTARKNQAIIASLDLSDDSPIYLVSRSWWRIYTASIKQMNQKANSHVRWSPDVNANINADLLCEHGGLTLDSPSRCIQVDASMWSLLTVLYPESQAFQASDNGCDICREQEGKNDELLQTFVQNIKSDLDRFPSLKQFMKVKHEIFPDERVPPFIKKPSRQSNNQSISQSNKIYLLPTSWVLDQFLPYYEQTNDQQSNVPILPPEPVQIRDRLLCKEHQRLLHNPRPLNQSINQSIDQSVNQSVDQSINQSDDLSLSFPGCPPKILTYCDSLTWSALCDLKYANPEDEICIEINQSVNQSISQSINEFDWSNLTFTINPPLCIDCINHSIQKSHAQKYSYSNNSGCLHVHLVDLDTSLEQFKPINQSINQSNNQSIHQSTVTTSRSRRIRRVESLETFDVYDLNACDPISLVKLKMTQSCSYNPASMVLYYQGRQLLDSFTLAYYQVPDRADIYMKVDTHRAMENDEEDEIEQSINQSNNQSNGIESGFKGTKLSSNQSINQSSIQRPASVNLVDSPPLLPNIPE